MNQVTRREFLGTTAVAGAAMTLGVNAQTATAAEPAKKYKTQLFKSYSCPKAANIKEIAPMVAAAGYTGIEIWDWDVDIKTAREARAVAEANGLRIHSLVRAWTTINNAETFAKDVESVKKALRSARAYNADAILWVPCRVAAPAINPWEFKIEYDPATLQVSKVVAGDNAPFADYIAKQNEANAATAKAIEELIPVAAYEGVTLALENVWNQLWVMPQFAAAYIKQFDNLWVKSYFDLGNNAKYARTEEWLKALGRSTIAKLHIKDFLIDRKNKNGGQFVPIGFGSIDWIAVRNAIEEIGYNGWVNLEDVKHFTPEEHSKILDGFFAGKLTKAYAAAIKNFG